MNFCYNLHSRVLKFLSVCFFADFVINSSANLMDLAGEVVFVDIGPSQSPLFQSNPSPDIACKYVNLKLVRGKCRGKNWCRSLRV